MVGTAHPTSQGRPPRSEYQRMNTRILLVTACLTLLAGCGKPTVANRGGGVLVYGLAPQQTAPPEEMARALQQRLFATGFPDAIVSAEGTNVRIELPGRGPADVARAKQLVTAGGHLEFLICAERGTDDAVIEQAEAAPESAGKGYRWVRFDRSHVEPYGKMVVRKGGAGHEEILMLVDADVSLTGNDLKSAQAGRDEGNRPCVNGAFGPEGSNKMGHLTQSNLKRHLGIVWDGELLSAPVIQSKVDQRFQLTGNFSQEKVDAIAGILRSGTLPGRLNETPVSEEHVEPKK